MYSQAKHIDFVPIPWEWLRTMSNEILRNQPNCEVAFTDTNTEETMRLISRIPKGTDCVKMRQGENTVFQSKCELLNPGSGTAIFI